MDVVVERCAGLDVHKASVTGCVRFPGARGRRKSEQARFGTTTRELHELSAWLTEFGVTEFGVTEVVHRGRPGRADRGPYVSGA